MTICVAMATLFIELFFFVGQNKKVQSRECTSVIERYNNTLAYNVPENKLVFKNLYMILSTSFNFQLTMIAYV